MHPLIVEAKGFGDSFAFVVAAANPNSVHTTAVTLRLGMNLWVTIHFTGAGQKQTSTHPSCQAKHIVCAEEASLCGFDRIELVVDGRCRTSKVPDAIYLKPDRVGDVVPYQLKLRVIDPLADIAFPACEIVIKADHLVPSPH